MTKPVIEGIQSGLELAVDAMPDNLVIKGKALQNKLMQMKVKKEEITSSGVLDDIELGENIVTKADLKERVANRTDIHRTITLQGDDVQHKQHTLRAFQSPNYFERVRRYSNTRDAGERNIKSHYPQINDELWETRGTISTIEHPESGEFYRGAVVMELQSDLHQTGRRYGYDIQDTALKYDSIKEYRRGLEAKQAALTAQYDELNSGTYRRANDINAEDYRAQHDSLYDQIGEVEAELTEAFKIEGGIESNFTAAERQFKDFMAHTYDRVSTPGVAKNQFEGSGKRLQELGIPQDKIEQFQRQLRGIEARYPFPDAEEMARLKKEVGNDEFLNPSMQIAKERSIAYDRLIERSFRDPDFIANLDKNRQFGLSHGNTPFKKNWLNKAVEEELMQAEMQGLEYMAIPLEVGTDELQRGPGVQKWYSKQVRDTLKKKEKTLNTALRQYNKNVTPDQLFKYEEITVGPKTVDVIFTNDTKLNDIDTMLETMPSTELRSFALNEQLVHQAEIDSLAVQSMKDGTYINLAHAQSVAVEDLLRPMLGAMTAEDLNGFFTASRVQGEDTAHTLGVLFLPKDKMVVPIKSRGSNSSVMFDPDALEDYIDKATLSELSALTEQSKFIEMPSHDLTYDAKADLKQYFYDQLRDVPARPEIEALSARLGIKIVQKPAGSSMVNVPTWQTLITGGGLYAAAPIPSMRMTEAGPVYYEDDKRVPRQALSEALDQASKAEVADYLVNNQGYDRANMEQALDSIMTDKVKVALDSGHSSNEVFDHLLARGFEPKDINKYLPNESTLETVLDHYTNMLDMTNSMAEKAVNIAFGITVGNDPDAATIAARVIGAEETVDAIWENMMAPFSRTMAIRAQTQVDALNVSIIRELQEAGLEAQIGQHGTIMVPDANGTYVPLDSNWYDIMIARKDEVALAMAGAAAAMKRAPKHPLAQFVAGVAGGAIGAGFGRGTDIVRNQLHLKEEIQTKFVVDEMIKAGASDAVFATLGIGAITMSKGVWKATGWAWDKVVKGNKQGALRALLEFKHITREQAEEIVARWEKVNDATLPGDDVDKIFGAITRGEAGAATYTGPASKVSSKMSINASREINERAQDLKAQAATITNENLTSILTDELPRTIKKARNTYDATKEIAIRQMKGSNYAFDYDKLVIEPTLDEALQGIENPAIRKQANRLFSQIQKIGGKEVETLAGTVPNTSRRTFKELLELRELVAEFGAKRNVTKPKDKDMVNTMLRNIDTEIKRAVRGNMEGADQWLKAWDPAKQGMENVKDLEKNVLLKAIIKSGATNKTVANALIKKAESLDSTYREILQALPPRLQAPTEAAVIQGLVEKFTIGAEGGNQAIDFVALAKELQHISFATKANKDMKQAIGELARVFKSDPHILASTGTVKLDSFSSYLTDNPAIRIKYMGVSMMFNYIKRLAPTEGGRKTAMVMATANALEKPADSIAVAKLLKLLPDDPAGKNALKKILDQIAAFSEKSNHPRVPVYSVQPKGHSATPTKGELGTGKYLYVNKQKARAKSRISGGKLEEKLLLPAQVADEFMIREVLGLQPGIEITPKLIRTYPRLKEKLESRGFSGLMLDDTVMLF